MNCNSIIHAIFFLLPWRAHCMPLTHFSSFHFSRQLHTTCSFNNNGRRQFHWYEIDCRVKCIYGYMANTRTHIHKSKHMFDAKENNTHLAGRQTVNKSRSVWSSHSGHFCAPIILCKPKADLLPIYFSLIFIHFLFLFCSIGWCFDRWTISRQFLLRGDGGKIHKTNKYKYSSMKCLIGRSCALA